MDAFPRNMNSLRQLVRRRLFQHPPVRFDFNTNGDLHRLSAVLFLLGCDPLSGESVVILNKRSQKVPQPGDLCCPGGGISPAVDGLLTHGLRLPSTPLTRWPQQGWWRRHRRQDFAKLTLLLAAGLREGFEEMRLNPFGVSFLGPMPVQHLTLFKRAIYPLAGWVNRQQRFTLNWEVERIVRIPLADFFDTGNYARYRITFNAPGNGASVPEAREMPCFVHRRNGSRELLWGVTFRITVQFLETVFGFALPSLKSMPVIHRRLGERYLEGSLLGPPKGAGG